MNAKDLETKYYLLKQEGPSTEFLNGWLECALFVLDLKEQEKCEEVND